MVYRPSSPVSSSRILIGLLQLSLEHLDPSCPMSRIKGINIRPNTQHLQGMVSLKSYRVGSSTPASEHLPEPVVSQPAQVYTMG